MGCAAKGRTGRGHRVASDAETGWKKEKERESREVCVHMTVGWPGKHFLVPEPLAPATQCCTVGAETSQTRQLGSAPRWKIPGRVSEGGFPCVHTNSRCPRLT